MQGHNKFMFIVAAALASSGVLDLETDRDGKFGLQAAFASDAPRTEDGMLRTSKDYAIRIDRLVLDSDALALEVGEVEAQAGELGDFVELAAAELEEGPLGLVAGGFEPEPGVRLQLQGVFVEGRVFDLRSAGQRLPAEGLGISGTLPIDVRVKQERDADAELMMAVEFELPQVFLDGIDWGCEETQA